MLKLSVSTESTVSTESSVPTVSSVSSVSTELSVPTESSVSFGLLDTSVSSIKTLTGAEIAALAIGLSIFVIITGIFFGLFYSDNKNKVVSNKVFLLKKWMFIFGIVLLNAMGCVLVYYTRSLQVILYIILILKSNDILMSVMFICNMIYKAIKGDSEPNFGQSEDVEKIVAFVPVCKERLEQVEQTIDSLISNKLGSNYLLTTVISDGHNDYSDIFTSITKENNGVYKSWNGDQVNVKITYGQRNNKPMILIRKYKNLGKKDSIILFNDIFNHERYNLTIENRSLKEDILSNIVDLFGVNRFNYIYGTDGDTIVSDTNLMYLLDTMKRRDATACCGIVNVNEAYGNFFWNLTQNYQYLYGQFMRRTNEDLFNQVLCLPGCNTMYKIENSCAESMTLYSEMTQQDNLIKSSVQNIGTDRRFTGSLIYTNSTAKIVMDTRAHVYTISPDSFKSYINQRKRWCNNMYFNSLVNIIAPNINFVLRFFNFINVLRLSLIYFRLFNTLYFIYLLSAFYDKKILDLLPYIVILVFPVFCFMIYSLFNSHLRNQYHKLLLSVVFNKIFTFFTTVIIFTVMLYHIGMYSWVTHDYKKNNRRSQIEMTIIN
jgi:cellulose synthase/poly-beta-1,6-N-acetylglucosamine synthase-like glycosyltransferase|uniref:Chitin synthase n=1 Tax=viral metagenome TaxID=1070528 RepID=A0A6C0AM23_9ZZZZ